MARREGRKRTASKGRRRRTQRSERDDAEASDDPGARRKARARAAGRRTAVRVRVAAERVAAAGRNARANARERRARNEPAPPSLAPPCLVRAPSQPARARDTAGEITVATYNVHRWTGLNGRKAPDPARAGFVISELDADVIALQEVLRPAVSAAGGEAEAGRDDPLIDLSEALGMHLVFAVTREHKRGQLGNAILSRFPLSTTSVVDISFSRIERRGALAAQFNGQAGHLGVVATHLSLVDRTRRRQVQTLLDHPQLNSGPVVLLGDMNAWRRCAATRELDDSLRAHHNLDWPASFPSAAPVLALDRIYARGAHVSEVFAHDSPAARRASDHLPIVARIEVEAG